MTTPTREPLSKTDIARICRDCYGRPRFGESEYLFAKAVERKVSAELEATIEQLRCELDGEKAAALNYRADAIKAEKQRDDLLEVLEEAKEFIGKFPVQTSTLSSGHRLVSDPVPIMRFISEIDAAIASVKGGAA